MGVEWPDRREDVLIYAREPSANFFSAGLVSPIAVASSVARGTSHPSMTTRLISHIAATLLAEPQ